MKHLLFNLVLYALVLVMICLSAIPGGAFVGIMWVLPLLLGSALLLGVLLPFWFEGGIKNNLRRSLRITFPAVAILFLSVHCLFCLSVLL